CPAADIVHRQNKHETPAVRALVHIVPGPTSTAVCKRRKEMDTLSWCREVNSLERTQAPDDVTANHFSADVRAAATDTSGQRELELRLATDATDTELPSFHDRSNKKRSSCGNGEIDLF
ncbi:hypothetical protein EVAR_74151_1, partial [Eumeta japonica]